MPEQPQILYKNRYVDGIHRIDVYTEHGGYDAFRIKALTMTPEAIIDEVKASSLRGRGARASRRTSSGAPSPRIGTRSTTW